MIVTVDVVKQRVAAIQLAAAYLNDEARASRLETDLYASVLAAIVKDPFEAQVLAREALRARGPFR